jgi:hypothetical protein
MCKSYTENALVVKNPSKALVNFVNKLRERKMQQLEELRSKKDIYFPNAK